MSKLATIICATILAAFMVATHQRNKVWASEESLWRDVTAKSPDKARGHMNLGVVLQQKGQWNDALISYGKAETAARLHPDVTSTYFGYGTAAVANMASIYMDIGMYGEAERILSIGGQLHPPSAAWYTNSAVLLMRTGRVEAARDILTLGIYNGPTGPLYFNRGDVYCMLGQREAAEDDWERGRWLDRTTVYPPRRCDVKNLIGNEQANELHPNEIVARAK